ncbi:hypothetical protein PC129_g14144 [Phytophthora cactorum]|uniref:Temptin Cys/Cys disulfide domain-containing protein n=1 Tax=Phytophthora cactorum TaxID=29920 RepID=A0A329S0J9_9STRA|nr:hypothetical protein Pcac1_g7171 [Phytophthora cactorum]KAG2808190.1 hypothetical protein PC112_g17066 [Phytophthora cactorum]KAG2815396.1 hypothetical protein PC111_g13589 [Phytophthora cactorum]KAG2851174.1 hypothetical protein PC113_g16142 [Phytophthora cactorum]KAG2887717.1 hypothetical protein PC114_g18705 [Phytophthora cactorum]
MLKLTKSAAVLSLLSASVFENVNGYPKYVARLPNGENVKGVAALGHVNVAGGGDRNEFGENFEQRGELWTKELCEADSDGDGQTNGQELGDPCCEWNAATASTPRWTEGVSHPGDAKSKSNETLWANIDCSTAATTNVTAGSTDDDSDSEVTVGGSNSTDASGGTTPATSGGSTCTTTSAMVSLAVLLLAFVA